MVQHETGNGLYAYPRGRPGRDSSQIGEKLPCPVDVDQKLCPSRIESVTNLNQQQHIPTDTLVNLGRNLLVLKTVQQSKFKVFNFETINLM